MTLYDLIEQGAQLHRNRPAVIFEESVTSYAALRQQTDRIAASLQEVGIHKGDKVAVWLPNNNLFIPVYLGITAIGAVMVPMNTRYRTHEVSYILNDADVAAIVMVSRFLKTDYQEILREALLGTPAVQHIIMTDSEEGSLPSVSWRAFLDAGSDRLPATTGVTDDDVAQILYTSGTTGNPKGVMLTHRNVCTNARVTGEVMAVTAEDRYFVPLPLFHSFGLVLGCLTPLIFGSSIVLQEVFEPQQALTLMERHCCTMNFGVPTMFMMELEELRKNPYTLSLRSGMMGGAPCPIEVVRGAREEMGCNVLIGYGITETAPLISLTRYSDSDVKRAESVGLPLPGVEVKVVNDQRQEVPAGDIGEIASRGNTMNGYYKMPEATSEVLDRDGWYYSGDLGKVDREGYLYITGRKKDMIVVGGFNVYPRELEEVLFNYPGVKNAAVVGVPDKRLGEVIKAYLISDGTVTADEIQDFCRGQMANYKVPTYVAFVDTFPMTASGKVQKYKLREHHDTSL